MVVECESGQESSSPGEESESDEQISDEPNNSKMSEYEKQRLTRIAENKARLEALGISKSAKALLLGSRKRKEKTDSGEDDDDDDYKPGQANDDDDDEEFMDSSSSAASRKTKSLEVNQSKKNVNRSETLGLGGDDDEDFNKAIALSLQGSEAGLSSKKKKMKKKPELMLSKVQMTDDELVIYFYQFDEAGKGFITLRDVERMGTVHDFIWTQEELQDMIRCFDMDNDGKLSLDEFRKIVTRCRMLKESFDQ